MGLSSLHVFWVSPPSRLEEVFSFACKIKLSCNTGPSIASNFCCDKTELRTLHTPLTLPVNIQDWFPLGLTGWISLQSKGLSRVFSNTTVQKHQFFGTQLSSQSNSHPYMTTGKTIALTRQTFVGKVMSLLLNMLSRLVIAFLPRSKHLLISWLVVILKYCLNPSEKNKRKRE